MAPHATVALNRLSPWHDATEVQSAAVAPDARVERFAIVKRELRVPNTVNYSLFPTLDPFAKAVYYQLFLVSHGFCYGGILCPGVYISGQNSALLLRIRAWAARPGNSSVHNHEIRHSS